MDYAVDVRNLTKVFQPGIGFYDHLIRPRASIGKFKALDNVTFTIPKGRIVALLGPNGAGKTTLMKILATLIYPDAGSAAVNGFDVVRNDTEVKRSIGMVVNDENSFYWRLTGYQNLEFFSYLNGLSGKTAARKIREVCELFEIEEPHRRYQEYSTGTKQRLALARALLADPAVVFMDEPTRSIDPASAAMFRSVIKERIFANGKRTVFFITHNPREAEAVADDIAVLSGGVLKAIGPIDALRRLTGLPGAALQEIFAHLIR